MNNKRYFAVSMALLVICMAVAFISAYNAIRTLSYSQANTAKIQAWIINPEKVKAMDIPVNVYYRAESIQGQCIEGWIHNNLTTPGLNNWLRHRLFNSSFTAGPACYIAIGTGTDDADPTNNEDLVNQIDCKQATEWIPGSGQFGLNATFTFTSSYTIKEAGVKTGSSGYLVFYVNDLNLSVDNSWTLTLCWIITISEA